MSQKDVQYEDLGDNKLKQDYYRMKFYVVIPDQDEPEDITNYTGFILIESNFEEQKFPVMKVRCQLPKKLYLKLYKVQEKLVYLLKIEKYKMESKTERNGILLPLTKQPMSELEYFKDVLLKTVNNSYDPLDQDDEQGNEDKAETITTIQDGNNGNMYDNAPMMTVDLYLFKREHLLFNKLMNPAVFTDTNLATVLLYLVQRNSSYKQGDLYIGTLDNTKKYEQIIIPPLNLFDSIRYLQATYGLYNNGVQVFADYKNFFIEDKCKVINIPDKKRGHSKGLIELYSIKDKDTDITRSNLKWFCDKKNIYIIRTSNRPTVDNTSNIGQEEIGEKVTIYSNNIKKHSEENMIDMRFGNKANDKLLKETYYWNPYSHSMIESEFKIDNVRSFYVLGLELEESNLESFILNRQYEVIDYCKGIDIKANGNYKIVDMTCLIENDGKSGSCKVFHKIKLKKITEKE